MIEDLIHLEVVTPAEIVIDTQASKVSAEAVNGAFTLLPRHVDFVASLVPGLLTYVAGHEEHLLAIDAGLLVKRGPSVRLATGAAVAGEGVLDLQRSLRASFDEMIETEQKTRSVLLHLETDAVRRLIELEDHD